jgi:hypothetical protein
MTVMPIMMAVAIPIASAFRRRSAVSVMDFAALVACGSLAASFRRGF